MDLKELIDKRIDDKLGASQGLRRVPAKVLSVQSDYLRADVELVNGTECRGMLNKSCEKLTAGQTVYVEYMTLPSSGYIAMTTGEADLLSGGGGEPGTSITIDNAAIVTPIQASKFITDEEVIYVDEEELVKIVYGQIPNWFYVGGYPCRLRSTTSATALSDAEVSAIAAADLSLLPSVYEMQTSSTSKYRYHSDMYAFELRSANSQWYLRYTIDVKRTTYTYSGGEWVEGSTQSAYSTGSVYYDMPVTFDSGGRPTTTTPLYAIGIYAFTTSYGANDVNVNIVPVAIFANTTTGVKTAALFTRSGSAISPVSVSGVFYKSDAEKIFALGMTHTTEVIDE